MISQPDIPSAHAGELVAERWWMFFCILLIIFALLFNTSALIVSMVEVKKNLHLSFIEMSWLVAGYFITVVSFFGLSAQLSQRYGAEKIFVCGFLIFFIAIIILSACQGVATLMVGRVIQGIGVGLMVPCSMMIVRRIFSDEEMMVPVIIWSTIIFFSYMLGVILGAVMTGANWRLNYWVLFVTLLPFAYLLVCFRRIKCPTTSDPCDVLGSALVLLFIVLFVLLFSTPTALGWRSPAVITFIAVTPVAFLAFLISQIYAKNPVMPLYFFKNIQIDAAFFNLLSVGVIVFGTTVTTTYLFESPVFPNAGVIRAGACLVPYFASLALTSSRFSFFKKYFSFTVIFFVGSLLILGGQLSFIGINAATGYGDMWWRFVLSGLGVGLLWGGGVPFCSSLVTSAEVTAMAGVTWLIIGIGAILGVTLAPFWYVSNFKHQAMLLLSNLHLSFGQVYSLLNAAHDSKSTIHAQIAAFPLHDRVSIAHALQSSVVSAYKGSCMLNVIFSGLVCALMLFYILFLNHKRK